MNWDGVFSDLTRRLEGILPPSVSRLAADAPNDPFLVLISTMISLRTKDDVTYRATRKLFEAAGSPEETAALSAEEIAHLIYPAGFYRTKAAHIRETAERIVKEYGGRVPSDPEILMSFPGVGRKTANLVLNLGFGIPAICVDTHVHRISNRIGWVETKTPEETERALEKILPEKFRIPINGILVAYGKEVCTPLSPKCGTCPLRDDRCARRGVGRRR